jgi:hypothetical protein
LAVHRPSRQSARRLANRNFFKHATSFGHNQLSSEGTSLSICSTQ